MKSKRIFVLAMCLLLAVAGQSFAVEFGWPLPGYGEANITATYTYPSSGSRHSCRYSTPDGRAAGIDIGVAIGTKVYAPADGEVRNQYYQSNGFGYHFEILHDDGTVTLYAHLSEYKVRAGQRVSRGDLIALTGKSGGDYGPHLHYEMKDMDGYQYYKDKGYRDPRNPREFEEDETISPGLRALTASSYAKIYTLENKKYRGAYADSYEYDYYNKLYTDSSLTTLRSSSSWTGEDDEIWLTNVGRNSSGTIYGQISYPTPGSRVTAYVNLKDVLVPDGEIVDGEPKTAKRSYFGFYKRKNSGYISYYGLSVGQTGYLLTKSSGWCQVLYPAGGLYYAVWMTEQVYKYIFDTVPPEIPPVITSVPFITTITGKEFSYQCKADNNPTSWRMSNKNVVTSNTRYKGTPPPGLKITSKGLISGKIQSTTEARKNIKGFIWYGFDVTASNSAGSDTRGAIVYVYEYPEIITNSLSPAEINKYYSQTIEAEGTADLMTWRIKDGKLPPGLTFKYTDGERKATISGTPTERGSYTFTIEIKMRGFDNEPIMTTTKTFTIIVGGEYPEPNMYFNKGYDFINLPANTDFDDAVVGEYYSSKVALNFNSAMYYSRWIMKASNVRVVGGSLPPSLEVRRSDPWSVEIYGTPTKAGEYMFALRAVNGMGGYAELWFPIIVKQSSSILHEDPNMSTRLKFANGKTGTLYDSSVIIRGGIAPYRVERISGTIPPGLELFIGDAFYWEDIGGIAYLYIKGKPASSGTYNFRLRVIGAHNGYAEKDFKLTISKGVSSPAYAVAPLGSTRDEPAVVQPINGNEGTAPKFSSAKLPDATIGSQYYAELEAEGTQPIAWSIDSADVPEGFNLTEDGKISFFPLEVGKYKLKVTAENAFGSATKKITLKVSQIKPLITTMSFPDGAKDISYSAKIEVYGTDPIKFSKSGKFPKGLKLDKKTGEIAGTPTKAGEFNFKIKAKNKADKDTVQFKIKIDDPEASGDIVPQDASIPAVVIHSIAQDYGLNDLYVINDNEEIFDEFEASEGSTLTFGFDEWIDEFGDEVEVSDVKIFLDNQELEGVTISEAGTFTLPAELVTGEISVYVSAKSGDIEFRTSEVKITTQAQSGNSNGEGCNLGLSGFAFAILALILKKR